MPGGQEPKEKKRKRPDRREKEKPLLAVQGLLRLDHCFVTPKNEEATVLEVDVGKEKKGKVVMAPGDGQTRSEHDQVSYKSGYDTGPSNPLPQDEREEAIFAQQKVLNDANEYFEELKKDEQEKREEREAAWAEQELSAKEKEEKRLERKRKREAKVAEKEAVAAGVPLVDPSSYGYAKDDDPDNPENYVAPDIEPPSVFGNLVPPPSASSSSTSEAPKAATVEETSDLVGGELKPPGEEDEVPEEVQVAHESGNTRVVVLNAGEEIEGSMETPELRSGKMHETATDGEEYEKGDMVSENVTNMAMAVALEMEEKRRRKEWEEIKEAKRVKEAKRLQKEADELAKEAERSDLSLDELTTLRQLEAKLGVGFGQSTGPQLPTINPNQGQQQHRQALDAYWEFVRDNPQDFSGWAYLIQASEVVNIMDEIRTVYNAFLPLFPYCYAYWKRYSDIERKAENWQRALAILHRGLGAVPLSVDLWVAYLELYHKMYSTHENFGKLFREQCEKAIATAGLEYRADPLWEYFLERETSRENLRFVTDLYRRVVGTPTKLYNKHWDNFIAHVRDHHPRDILQYQDYEGLRRLTCKELGLKYRPDPVIDPKKRKVELPEDKLKAGMKERLVASLVSTHEATEARVDQIYRFEEKLKRTYFHVKPLDHRQLRTWDQYLDYEVAEGDHERIVVLFERCLIPCALYEQFWAKYARYLEKAHKEGKDVSIGRARLEVANDVRSAREAFNTGLGGVDARRDARSSWTLQGWAEKTKDRRGRDIVVMRGEDTGVKEMEDVQKENDNVFQVEGEKEAVENVENGEVVEGLQIGMEPCLEDNDVDMLDSQSAAGKEGEQVESDNEKETEKDVEENGEDEDLSKLKVVELRSRLQEAGLNCRGTKAVLVERLVQLKEEKKDEEQTEEMDEVVGATGVDEDVQMEDQEKDQAEAVTIEDVPDEDGCATIRETVSNHEEEEGTEALDSTTNYSKPVDDEMEGVVVSSAWQEATGWEAVRDVYRRACVVHCPRKAVIRMKWAQFEENIGEVVKAREILAELVTKYPMLLEARMQQIDLERRERNYEDAEKMYTKLMKQIPSKHEKYKNMKTWIAMKYARFQFKICGNADKSLAALRSALKKERGNPRLYSQIIDICYQRQPVDVTGVTAAIELALVSKDLTNMAKLEFVQRKVEFMQEFGDVGRYRDAWDQLKAFRHLCSSDLKVEARRKKELDEEEERMLKLEEQRAHATAEANMKAKIAESEGRLLCSSCQAEMLPNEHGVYDFEKWQGGTGMVATGGQNMVPTEQLEEDAVIDLMDFDMDPEEEDRIKRSLEEKTKYKQVAPTWELNIEKYGYGAKRKAYDADYEHVETAKYQEYARLEEEGYDEEVKDPEQEGRKSKPAKGLGLQPGQKANTEKTTYVTSDYIIAPKVPQANLAPPMEKKDKRAPGELELEEHEQFAFELPPELADPSVSPCVNVPEWFVREGGELCLSETAHGTSVIRYWPKFLSEKGNDLMLNRLRRYCKWHQKQVKVAGEWKYQPRLVSWYGPCEYEFGGLTMEKNLNWAPELLDLLHRLISMTRHEFNSCFLNLYRHGYDMCGWHADTHPKLGRNPPVASVSLGAVRVFEFRKKAGAPNFIRFPLFPGSLLLMEGAVQEDWLHCLPKDPPCKEERVNLTFRTMYSADHVA